MCCVTRAQTAARRSLFLKRWGCEQLACQRTYLMSPNTWPGSTLCRKRSKRLILLSMYTRRQPAAHCAVMLGDQSDVVWRSGCPKVVFESAVVLGVLCEVRRPAVSAITSVRLSVLFCDVLSGTKRSDFHEIWYMSSFKNLSSKLSFGKRISLNHTLLQGLNQFVPADLLFQTCWPVWLKCGRVQLKCDGTRWPTGGEVKGKLANGVGSQYPSHYHGTWCIQH